MGEEDYNYIYKKKTEKLAKQLDDEYERNKIK